MAKKRVLREVVPFLISYHILSKIFGDFFWKISTPKITHHTGIYTTLYQHVKYSTACLYQAKVLALFFQVANF